MKKIMLVLILLFSCLILGCNQDSQMNIDYNELPNTFKVGENFVLNSYINNIKVNYKSLNPEVVLLKGNYGEAITNGETVICAYDDENNLIKKYLISVVNNKPTFITINGGNTLTVGKELQLYLETDVDYFNAIWESNNEDIAVVDKGKVIGKGVGIVTITVSCADDPSVFDEHMIWVESNNLTEDFLNDKYQSATEVVDLGSLQGVLEPIIKKTQTSVIGVNGYTDLYGVKRLNNSGTGVIYKRLVVLENGDLTSENDGTGMYYQYYVITSKSIVNKCDYVSIYYNDLEIDAEVIAVDEKVDIGVLTFNSKDYFSEATFGDSNNLVAGEFIIALGNTFGKEYYNSSTFGVVSYHSRYVSTDTDGDNTNDWDALYIQHDAAIGEGSSGGPLVNMKGEIIGINSVMISADEIDNMAFAIPINLVLELVELLEKGIVPTRPLLLISVLSVRDILKNDYLLEYYPVPEGLNYGMFVAEVTEGGVGSAAGMLPGDIIVEFNGQKIIYSYELRMMLNEVIIGSNQENIIVVNRNGTLVTLKVVF